MSTAETPARPQVKPQPPAQPGVAKGPPPIKREPTAERKEPAQAAPKPEAATPKGEPPAAAPPKPPEKPAAQPGRKDTECDKVFRMCMTNNGSDLHLKVGQPVSMRIRGDIVRMDMRPLTQEDMERILLPTLNPKQRKILDDEGGVDYSYIVGDNECRFRVSLFRQRGQLSLVARRINNFIPTFADLGLPDTIEKLCHYDQGMVVLAGVTGSGKSTTIASMLDYINGQEPLHILSIEDPIEFTYTDKKSLINQREIGLDCMNWHKALKDAVRQDPDIILVGELRDRDTFEAGIHAAETGHLVFGTIHAASAASTISRILDLFPPEMHHAIRQALAFNLKAVVAQKLLKGLKKPRVPTNEIMIVGPMIRELILREEDKKIPDAIRIGYNEGMCDFTESLRRLVAEGHVDKATALEVAPNPEQFKMALKGIKVAAPGIL